MDSAGAAPVSPGAGCPIRRPLDRSPSTAPQGFSQSPASFIGPRRPGIPRAPHLARRPPAGAPSRRDRPTPTPTHTQPSLSLSHHSPPVKDLGPDDLWLRARLRQQLPAKNRQLPQGKKIGLISIRPLRAGKPVGYLRYWSCPGVQNDRRVNRSLLTSAASEIGPATSKYRGFRTTLQVPKRPDSGLPGGAAVGVRQARCRLTPRERHVTLPALPSA